MAIRPIEYITGKHPDGVEDTETGEVLKLVQYDDHLMYKTPNGNSKELALRDIKVTRQGKMVALSPKYGKGTQVPAAMWSAFSALESFKYAHAKSNAWK